MSSSSRLPILRLASEFTVIVVGVLVALLAESAWQERGERAEERDVMRRIEDEIRSDSLRLAGTREWLDFAVPAAQRSQEILAGRDTLPTTGALALLYAAATVNTPTALVFTWDELRETGRTGLIEDEGVRRTLRLYYWASDRLEKWREELPERYRAMALGSFPTDYAVRVLARCLRAEDRPDARARSDAFDALLGCPESPAADAEDLLARFRALDGVEIELGQLTYELIALRGGLDIFAARRDSALAMFDTLELGIGR